MQLRVLLEVHEGLGTRPHGLLQVHGTGESAVWIAGMLTYTGAVHMWLVLCVNAACKLS